MPPAGMPTKPTSTRHRSTPTSPARAAASPAPDGSYRFVTIRPGAYPWRNHPNAWRPAHIHFSVFGRTFAERLVTQMYFPGDPLLDYDPIFLSVREPAGRARLISSFDWATTQEERALGYCFDIVVGGHLATPVEAAVGDELARTRRRPPLRRRSVPFFSFAFDWMADGALVPPGSPDALTIWGHILDGAGEPVPDAVVEVYQAAPAGPAPARVARPSPRSCTDATGAYRFVTAKPDRVDDRQAPHLDVSVFARGLLQRLWTRCYFPDEAPANAGDPVLQAIADRDRVATLIAHPDLETREPRSRGPRELALRHLPAGRSRDGVL